MSDTNDERRIGDRVRFTRDLPDETVPPYFEPQFGYRGAVESELATIIDVDETNGSVTVALDRAARTPLEIGLEDRDAFEKIADRFVDEWYGRHTPDEVLNSLQHLLPGTRIVFVQSYGYNEVVTPPDEPSGPEAKLGDFGTVVELEDDASAVTIRLDRAPEFPFVLGSENANFIWPPELSVGDSTGP